MVSKTKRQMGLTLILTGLLHTIVGLFVFMEQLEPLFTEGLWNTVKDGQFERGAAFWFMMFGFLLMIVGYLADWLMKRKEIAPPAAFGWMILIICVIGVIFMPNSGFWLGIPQGVILLRM